MDISCCSDDIAILVESLKSYKTLDPHTRQQAFGAIRSLLCDNAMAQDYFRELQGVELMITIYQHFRKYNNTEVIENALYTLSVAVERNDTSRSGLLTEEMFMIIKGAIRSALIASTFLLLSLTSNNVTGQYLSRTTHCINKLCHLLKRNVENEHETEESFKFCNALCTTLGSMISNPVNRLNQDICCRLFLPTLVRCLYKDMNRQLILSLIKLLGSCVIENSEAQTYFCVIGGIRALFTVISTWLSSNKLQSPCDFQFMMYLVNTLSCSYANHAVNKMKVIELDVIEGLLSCLQACRDQSRGDHVIQLQITCVMALLNLLDDSDIGKQKFHDKGGTVAVLELITFTKDENIKKLATALLQKTFVNEATERCSDNSMLPNTSGCIVNIHETSTANPDTIKKDKSTSTECMKRPCHQIYISCSCRVMPYVDSRNALKVLNSGLLCSQHTALANRMSRYIAKKKSQA